VHFHVSTVQTDTSEWLVASILSLNCNLYLLMGAVKLHIPAKNDVWITAAFFFFFYRLGKTFWDRTALHCRGCAAGTRR